jgi:hypothetical protein
VRNLVAPEMQGQRRKIVAVYLDPSNFKNIGDGHTILLRSPPQTIEWAAGS